MTEVKTLLKFPVDDALEEIAAELEMQRVPARKLVHEAIVSGVLEPTALFHQLSGDAL